MSGTQARLVTMANQIARNFAAQGDERAIAATAEHITLFWDPRMKAAILAGAREALEPLARAAVDRLADGAAPCPPPQASITDR